jgi:hypothetical protein
MSVDIESRAQRCQEMLFVHLCVTFNRFVLESCGYFPHLRYGHSLQLIERVLHNLPLLPGQLYQ